MIHCSWSRMCDVCTIKLLYFLDFRLVISKNLIKIEHTGMTESGGQECKVVTLWEGGRFSGKCLLLINIKTRGRFFSNFCSLFRKAGLYYGLSSFQAGGTKLERFLPKNQHTLRKLSKFENWCNGEVLKIGHH